MPWNKGKVIGAKPPLRPKHVWSIRTKLQVEGRTRDLAMFNLAIDSKLRGCDVVALKVDDRTYAPQQRPRRAANIYSMTSSARTNSVAGIFGPSGLVFCMC
jgi:hypothetical protein